MNTTNYIDRVAQTLAEAELYTGPIHYEDHRKNRISSKEAENLDLISSHDLEHLIRIRDNEGFLRAYNRIMGTDSTDSLETLYAANAHLPILNRPGKKLSIYLTKEIFVHPGIRSGEPFAHCNTFVDYTDSTSDRRKHAEALALFGNDFAILDVPPLHVDTALKGFDYILEFLNTGSDHVRTVTSDRDSAIGNFISLVKGLSH